MTKLIINCETGEIIERDLSEDEVAQQIVDEKEIEKNKLVAESKAEARAAARQAILDRLGLTEEEARLLLG